MSLEVNGPDGDTLAILSNGQMNICSGTVDGARAYFSSKAEHKCCSGTITREALLKYLDEGRYNGPPSDAEISAHLWAVGWR
jgi:hypothetical protein